MTYDRVCLIYDLIHDDMDSNVGDVVFSAMRKARFNIGHKYGFGGLLMWFFKEHDIEEEDLIYRKIMNTLSVAIVLEW